MEDVETVTVDSYTTLVDVGSQADALERHVDGIADPERVSDRWRCTYMQYSMVANAVGAYRPFRELIGLALDYALRVSGHEVPRAVRDRVYRAVYEEDLAVFDDVTDGLGRLADAGYDVYVLSNGDPEMLDRLLGAADLRGVVAGAVSADEVRTYKPDPAIYRHAAARVGTPIGRVLHVSGGTMRDAWGAKHAGMRAAWLARPERDPPREHLGPDPDLVAGSFHDLADRLG